MIHFTPPFQVHTGLARSTRVSPNMAFPFPRTKDIILEPSYNRQCTDRRTAVSQGRLMTMDQPLLSHWELEQAACLCLWGTQHTKGLDVVDDTSGPLSTLDVLCLTTLISIHVMVRILYRTSEFKYQPLWMSFLTPGTKGLTITHLNEWSTRGASHLLKRSYSMPDPEITILSFKSTQLGVLRSTLIAKLTLCFWTRTAEHLIVNMNIVKYHLTLTCHWNNLSPDFYYKWMVHTINIPIDMGVNMLRRSVFASLGRLSCLSPSLRWQSHFLIHERNCYSWFFFNFESQRVESFRRAPW